MKKRALSALLTLCMVLTMLPTEALAAEFKEWKSETLQYSNEFAGGDRLDGSTEPIGADESIGISNINPTSEVIDSSTSDRNNGVDNDDSVNADDQESSDFLASGFCGGEGDGGKMQWTLSSDGVLHIWGTGEMSSCAKSGVDGPAPNAPWYAYRENIISVIIEEGVTSIGMCAFCHCYNLKSVSMPDSVTKIESANQNKWWQIGYSDSAGAFFGCTKLETIQLSDNLIEIGTRAFMGCTALQSLVIPACVTSIQDSAFQSCSSLNTVEFSPGSKCKLIGRYAFAGCRMLSDPIFPDSITAINAYAFQNCTSLKNVSLPGNLLQIGGGGITLSVGYGDMVEYNGSVFSGCSNLVTLFIPESVANIYNMRVNNKDQGGTLCPKTTLLLVMPGSVAEKYAKANNLKYEYLTPGRALSVHVSDENGQEISDGFTVTWYDETEREIGTGFTLSGIEDDKSYSYYVLLGESLSSIYYQPELQIAVPDDNDQIFLVLKKIPAISVSGSFANIDGKPLANVTIIFAQSVNGRTLEAVAYTDSGGSYSAEILNVPTEMSYYLEGYRPDSMIVIMESGSGEHLNIGTLFLSKLLYDQVRLSLKMKHASRSENTPETSGIYSLSNLDITIYNETQNTSLSDAIIQYPYIMFAEGSVASGDRIAIRASDKKSQMADATDTVMLDETRTGIAELNFVQNGCFQIENSGSKCRVLVFDNTGWFIAAYSCDTFCTSEIMPNGDYTLALFADTGLLTSVSDISGLTNLGLRENTDYLVKKIQIQSGLITIVSDISVPVLEERQLYFTALDNTSFRSFDSAYSLGRCVYLHATYEIPEEYSSSGEAVTLELPAGISIAQGGVLLKGKPAVYTTNSGNSIIIHTGTRKGTLYFYAVAQSVGTHNIHAFLSCQRNGVTIQQPLGTVCVDVVEAQFDIPHTTSREEITVVGVAFPNATVMIYDNGKYAGTTTSNGVGTWTCQFSLLDNYDFAPHNIYAVIQVAGIPDITTDEKELVYYSGYAQVSKVTIISNSQCTIDFLHPSQQTPHYSFAPSWPITFKVEFTENATPETVWNVSVVTTDSSGQRTYVPVEHDEVSGCWVGFQKYSSYAVPVNVGVIYDTDFSPSDVLSEYYEVTDPNNVNVYLRDDSTIGYQIKYYGETEEYRLLIEYFDSYEEKVSYIINNFDETAYEDEEGAYYWGDEKYCYSSRDEDNLFLVVAEAVSNEKDVSTKNLGPSSGMRGGCGCMEAGLKEGRTPGVLEYNAVQRLESCNCIERDLSYYYARKLKALGGLVKISIGLAVAGKVTEAVKGAQRPDLEDFICKNIKNIVEDRVLGSSNYSFDDAISSLATAHMGWLRQTETVMKTAGCYCSPSAPGSETGMNHPVTATIDPSGYVYEAVPSNRIEGATATIYQSNSPDGENAVLWDAEDYGQENPLITDREGGYSWLVPGGYWQVKIEKEGYETGYSEWLPVPPPQFDVNIGIVSETAPKVKHAVAYEDSIELVFSQYMDLESVVNAVTVMRDGTATEVNVLPLNAEETLDGGTFYATRFAVVPTDANLAGSLTVSVAVTAKNYTGKPLLPAYTSPTMTAKKRPEKILAPDTISAGLHSSVDMTVALRPAIAGTTLLVESLTPALITMDKETAVVIIGKEGTASIRFTGNLPGEGIIQITEPKSSLCTTVTVLLTLDEKTDTPASTYLVTVNGGTGGGSYMAGEIVTITATVPSGQRFTSWTVNAGGMSLSDANSATTTFTMPAQAITITANFEQIPGQTTGHTHIWSAAWSSNSTHHWHECIDRNCHVTSDSGKAGYATHASGEWIIDQKATFATTGRRHRECTVCSYTIETETIPATGGALSGGGSGGSYSSTSNSSSRQITLPTASNGTVTVSPKFAKSGEKVTITAIPNDGYTTDSITVMDRSEKSVSVTDNGDGTYSFVMPNSQVTVNATFVPVEEEMQEAPWANPFIDVSEGDWFYDEVSYVSQNGLMIGVSNRQFNPGGTTTRGMLMTILARISGVDTNGRTPWYQIGMEWAVGTGVSDGSNPEGEITREQLATMLWRYAGGPTVTGDLSGYPDASDVQDWASDAMIWAVQNGIINGSGGKLEPHGNALRSQAAAMLTRFCQNFER